MKLLFIIPVLFLTACNGSGPRLATYTPEAKNAQEARTGAIQATQALPGDFDVQAAVLTVAKVIPATLAPTPDATKAQMLRDQIAMSARLDQMQKDMDNRAAEIAKSNAEAAKANGRTAEIELTRAAVELKQATELTAQKQLDNERVLMQVEIDKAAAAVKLANADMLTVLMIGAAFIALMLVAVRAIWSRPFVADVQVEDEEPDSFGWIKPEQKSNVRPGSSADDSLQVDDAPLLEWLEYAIAGNNLGVVSAKKELTGRVTGADVELISVFVRESGYQKSQPLKSGGTRLVLNDAGMKWAGAEINRIANSPTPSQNIPQNSTPTGDAHPNTGVFSGGAVVTDDEAARD